MAPCSPGPASPGASGGVATPTGAVRCRPGTEPQRRTAKWRLSRASYGTRSTSAQGGRAECF
eukprot:2408858-Prymnesium_polylepis.1